MSAHDRSLDTALDPEWLRAKAQELRELARKSHRDQLLYLALGYERLAACKEIRAKSNSNVIQGPRASRDKVRSTFARPTAMDDFGFAPRRKKTRIGRWIDRMVTDTSLDGVRRLAERVDGSAPHQSLRPEKSLKPAAFAHFAHSSRKWLVS